MAYSDFKNTESWRRGMDNEDKLSKLLTENGEEHHKATEDENKKQHIDFHIKKYGRCDVKSMKVFHSGQHEQDEYICIEFQNNSGNQGWIDSETTDYIYLEFKNHHSVVKRSELCSLARKLCNIPTNDKGHVIPTRKEKEPYVLYHRRSCGNNDIFGYIKASDIDHLIVEKIPKTKQHNNESIEDDSSWML